MVTCVEWCFVRCRCSEPGCTKQPRFGFRESAPVASRCAPHRLPEMMNIHDAYCAAPSCRKFASHGAMHGACRKTHCAEHGALLGLVDVKHRICTAPGCATVATYGESDPMESAGQPTAEARPDKGGARAMAAAAAEAAEAADRVPTHCASHGQPLGLVDVQNPRCQHDGCNVRSPLPHLGRRFSIAPAVWSISVTDAEVWRRRASRRGASGTCCSRGHDA